MRSRVTRASAIVWAISSLHTLARAWRRRMSTNAVTPTAIAAMTSTTHNHALLELSEVEDAVPAAAAPIVVDVVLGGAGGAAAAVVDVGTGMTITGARDVGGAVGTGCVGGGWVGGGW